MTTNEQLDTLRRLVVDGKLGTALTAMENYLLTFPQQKETEQYYAIRDDYRLMMDYWSRGYSDPEREMVYGRLLQRMYVLTASMTVKHAIRNTAYVMGVYSRARASRHDWSVTSLRNDLEHFVSEQAMIALKPEHVREQERQQLFAHHHELVRDLFDYIWTSRLWSEGLSDAFIEMLLSPTIDSIDQQVIVSAITLSLLSTFDFQKWRVLTTVYAQTAEQGVRQRSLVGWVLGIDGSLVRLYPEMTSVIGKILSDDDCRMELKELQMQLIYCLKTDEDSRKIHDEVIPELIKNNNQFRVTRNGIEEIEEDPMEDILHPEAAEERMEQLEATMQKMMDMQKAGSDIYFGGFSQMKRLPFFQDTCNWLMPFYREHPALQQVWADTRRSRALDVLLQAAPFCASDTYSFALAFNQAFDHLPQNMQEMFGRGELSFFGEQMALEQHATPAYIRRMYLQDLYRFFRLHPSRHVFSSPFEASDGCHRLVFYSQTLFADTPLSADLVDMAIFLTKHHLYDDAAQLLGHTPDQLRDERFFLTYAMVLQHLAVIPYGMTVSDCYQRVLETSPQHEAALKGYARALFQEKDYQGALAVYDRLLAQHPDHRNYLLNKSICLGNLARYEEALKILYKLDYESSDDKNVRRVLAWTLTGSGKTEQAGKIYAELLENGNPQGDDLLNYGLCQWLAGDIPGASGLFRQYADANPGHFDAESEFLRDEASFLRSHGISEVEVRLMLDLLARG